jgi:hypothetical protein
MSDTPVARRTSSGERLVLTARDRQLLASVARFRLVSRDQAMALAPFGSLTRANTRLARLVRARLLARKSLPIFPGKGSAQALYYLGLANRTASDDSSDLTLVNQVRRIARWNLQQVTHVIAANQVLVDLLTALRQSLEADLLAFRTEVELRELLVQRELVPDGWIAWRQDGKRFNSFIEVDLHHEGLTAWRKKILGYQDYLTSGLHQELFGFRACRVLVLAKSRRRLANLRTLAQVAGRLCLFAELGTVGPRTIFSRVWLPASGREPVALREA